MRRRGVILAGGALALQAPLASPLLAQTTTQTGIRSRPAGEREALLMEGKRSLRQRVLTRPGAVPRPQPGVQAAAGGNAGAGAALDPLTPLYVYARAEGPDGQPWIEVGRAGRGAVLGWLPAREGIDWPHTMTAAFTNPAGRERTLFFRDRDALLAMLGGNAVEGEARGLAAAAGRQPVPDNFPVLAAEPATHVDIRSRFYLLPILQAESLIFQDGREFRMLEVASVPVAAPPVAPPPGPFTLGVAFLVDTSLSMDPYIDRVRNALNEVVRATARDPGRRTRYALLGFRNSLEAQPRLEYRTRVFARFADNADPAAFAARAAAMRATDVDSLSFNEDSFAAVMAALDELDWDGIAGKVLVLVTDAGSREDARAAVRMPAGALARVAQERGAAVMVLHLRTPSGRANHAFAERQYVSLSSFAGTGPNYFPVENGDEAAFDAQARRLIASLNQVSQAQANAAAPDARAPANPSGNAPGNGPDIAAQAAMVGHALRLAWLGRRDGAAAPALLRAWAADSYLPAGAPRRPENLEVRVLLTRNQLNDLAQSVRAIVEAGRSGMLDSEAVFGRLQSVAAHLARDPARMGERGMETLGDVLGEYLDGLPYVSDIASRDRASWRALGAGRQTVILDTLEGRLRAYAAFHRTPELWVSFDGGRDPGEAMFPVPLSLLP